MTNVNFDPSNTMVCILDFNCMSLSFANENLEKLNWLQISMFNYTLFCKEFDYFTTKMLCSILLLILSFNFLALLIGTQ